ncbi:MEIKN protein, partial [Geococcyx californianus]|nr:MEIKN protein [Geococcyx californianus]
MTLPSGVSTLLLQCLDSTIDYKTGASDSLSSQPSPETFRDVDAGETYVFVKDFGKYKNSTFLDPSKAVTIDKIPQVLNLSAISDQLLMFFPSFSRKRSSKFNYTSSPLSISTTLAGKKVCKITPARERRPDLKTGMRSPLGPERKPDNQTAEPKGLKRKKKEKHLEEGPPSLSLVGAPGNSSAKTEGLATEMLPSEGRGAAQPLCSKWEICSIVRNSPKRKPSKIRVPAKSQVPSPPQGLP